MGFGANSGLNEIALLGPGDLGQNVKLNAGDGPPGRQCFYRDRDGCNDATRGKPRAYELIRKRHAEACRMGGGDQFIGVGSLFFLIAGPEVLALRKGTAPRGYHAFSAPEIADPSGRGVWFHVDRFKMKKDRTLQKIKVGASRSNSRVARTRGPPSRRTAVSGVFIWLQPSRFRRCCANTLFLGSE
jgi:hypothetical protein